MKPLLMQQASNSRMHADSNFDRSFDDRFA
jgi:hypothetical protein